MLSPLGSKSHHTGIEMLANVQADYAGTAALNRTTLELKYQSLIAITDKAGHSKSHHTGIEMK